MKALGVLGTSSNAGKTWMTAALCAWLRREGVRVAPFKAQNMSNNVSMTLTVIPPSALAGVIPAWLGLARGLSWAESLALPVAHGTWVEVDGRAVGGVSFA
jgi:hypothetical protein